MANDGAPQSAQFTVDEMATLVRFRRLPRLSLGPLPPVRQNLDYPGLFLSGKLLLQRVEKVESVSGYDE